MAYVFHKFHICIFLSALKKKRIQTHCTYVWLHKGVKTQREHHVATRLPRCKNLTHMSKTRQAKRTQMVATAMFTIHMFVTFPDC